MERSKSIDSLFQPLLQLDGFGSVIRLSWEVKSESNIFPSTIRRKEKLFNTLLKSRFKIYEFYSRQNFRVCELKWATLEYQIQLIRQNYPSKFVEKLTLSFCGTKQGLAKSFMAVFMRRFNTGQTRFLPKLHLSSKSSLELCSIEISAVSIQPKNINHSKQPYATNS